MRILFDPNPMWIEIKTSEVWIMAKKRIVMAIGHKDLGTNLPEQKAAVARTAKVIADFI